MRKIGGSYHIVFQNKIEKLRSYCFTGRLGEAFLDNFSSGRDASTDQGFGNDESF